MSPFNASGSTLLSLSAVHNNKCRSISKRLLPRSLEPPQSKADGRWMNRGSYQPRTKSTTFFIILSRSALPISVSFTRCSVGRGLLYTASLIDFKASDNDKGTNINFPKSRTALPCYAGRRVRESGEIEGQDTNVRGKRDSIVLMKLST